MRVPTRNPKETGREYALRSLKDNIVHLDLAPGSVVSENEVASKLNLSRTPVREAFIELAKVKIIEVYPQKGSVVSFIDYNLVEEARFMRSVLECAVVELDCRIKDLNWTERLEDNVKLQEFYLDSRSPEKLLELDDEFHQMLFLMAGKSQIYELMDSFTIHFDRVRSMSLVALKDIKTVFDHQEIVKAIIQGDQERARTVMQEHLSRYKVDEAALRDKYPDYFK